MKKLINKNLNGKSILSLFVLTQVVYVIMLTITIPKVMSYSNGMNLLDMIPTGYNAEYVYSLLETLGEKGRHAYLFNQIPLDLIYPSLFGVTYCLLLVYVLQKLGKAESYLFYTCLIPLFSGLFDYVENIGIITMLKSYPAHSETVAQATSVFSVLKSSFTTVTLTLLLVFLITWGYKKLRLRAKAGK